MHLAAAIWAFLARVHCLPIHNHEETAWSAVAEAATRRQNGSMLMGEGLSSLVNLLHRHSVQNNSGSSALINSSEVTSQMSFDAGLINSSEVASQMAIPASQERTEGPKEQEINVSLQDEVAVTTLPVAAGYDDAVSITLPVSATENHDRRKEVQVHVAETDAENEVQSSHKSHSVASTASGRKQVVRSQSPSLQRDGTSRQADPRGFFWLHWELLRLAKPGLLVLGIFVTAIASMAFLKSRSVKHEPTLLNITDRSERLLAVAQRLHSSKEEQKATEPTEGLSDAEPLQAECTSESSNSKKMELMEELGFTVPSTDDLFFSPSKAGQKGDSHAKKAGSSTPHVSPELALSEETKSRRMAIINILKNLPDVKDQSSSSCGACGSRTHSADICPRQ